MIIREFGYFLLLKIMSIKATTLEDSTCKGAKPLPDREHMLFDGGCPGLHLHIAVSGKKTFRVRIKVDGKIKTHSIGTYPKLTLSNARIEAGIILRDGFPKDLLLNKTTFEVVANRWLLWKKTYAKNGKVSAEATHYQHTNYLNNILIPFFGKKDINEINRKLCNNFLVELNIKTPASADKSRQILNMIFKYAVRNELKEFPVDLLEITSTANGKKVDMPKDLPSLYEKCNEYSSPIMSLAMKLQHHIFLRSGEIMTIKKDDINLDKKLLTITAENMKMKREHIVPLTKQTIQIIKELIKLDEESEWLFPNPNNDKHMVRDYLSKSFRKIKLGYTPHNCRVFAGSWLKMNGVDPHIIEMQLAHESKNKVQSAYEIQQQNFYMLKRCEAMQKWSDFLETKTQEKENELIETISDVEGVHSINTWVPKFPPT